MAHRRLKDHTCDLCKDKDSPEPTQKDGPKQKLPFGLTEDELWESAMIRKYIWDIDIDIEKWANKVKEDSEEREKYYAKLKEVWKVETDKEVTEILKKQIAHTNKFIGGNFDKLKDLPKDKKGELQKELGKIAEEVAKSKKK